ncbi:MAG: hypothetical protein KDK37_04635, partial [Leptospiraceae bacterium]|nr:hypothetical protein [Leptospiraceae bacterium]
MYRLKPRNLKPVSPSGHTIRLFWEGDDFFDSLIEDIDRAQISICLESYIFHADRTGSRVVQALQRAARRGLRVRVLVDGIGSFPHWNLQRLFQGSTIAFRVFKPVGLFTILRSGFHRRNHRKLILIDDRLAYAGGMNIGDELSLQAHGQRRWRDSMIRVEGGSLNFLQSSFEQVWKYAAGPNFGLMPGMKLSRGELRAFNPTRAHCPDVLFLSNHGRRLRRAQRRFLVQLIQRARERIYIGSAYFIPARSILWLLRRKAKAGLDVRIITAGRS